MSDQLLGTIIAGLIGLIGSYLSRPVIYDDTLNDLVEDQKISNILAREIRKVRKSSGRGQFILTVVLAFFVTSSVYAYFELVNTSKKSGI